MVSLALVVECLLYAHFEGSPHDFVGLVVLFLLGNNGVYLEVIQSLNVEADLFLPT